MPPPDAPRAQLCFGQVRHRRLRPVLHSFAYASYYVRLPLRTLGQGGFGSALFSRNRFNLLSWYERDYGDGQQPLLAWLDGLLVAEGITDADGEAWLQTMPRVLGYAFNPVSFWFCHRRDGALRAVLCDVHNTFGERHLYLLDTGAAMDFGTELQARKVFHVSPFCKVEGRYRFQFLRKDQAGGDQTTLARVDYDDDTGALLETSWAGRARPVSNASVLRAFFAYPLMTAFVVLRIHLQALRLWWQRVPFFSKPSPPQHKVSR